MSILNKFLRFLRWTEGYTKTDMVYLVQGISWLTITQAVASLFGFLIVFFMANTLHPGTLGEFRLLMTGFTLICIFALPGMRTALRESVPKGYRGNLGVSFWAMFRWGLLGTVFSILTAIYFYINNDIGLAIGFMVIAAIVPFYNSATGFSEYLIAIKFLRLNTIFSVSTRFITFISAIIAVYCYPDIAWIILCASLLGTLIPNLFFHFKVLKNHCPNNSPTDKSLISYAKNLSVMTALGVLAGQLDKILIWNAVGAESLALFFIAQAIPQNITSNLNTIPTLAFAKFGEKKPGVVRKTLLPKILKYLVVISATSLIYCLLAPSLFSFLFPTYLDALPYSLALAFVPVFGAFLPLKTYLTVAKATKQLYLISIIPPAARIILALLLIQPLGLWGAIYAIVAEASIRSAMLLYFFLKS